jgi:hypothetical protein
MQQIMASIIIKKDCRDKKTFQLFRSGTNKHSQVTVPGLPYKMVGAAGSRPLYMYVWYGVIVLSQMVEKEYMFLLGLFFKIGA